MSQKFNTLELTIKKHVAQITLNRPDSANGLNLQMSQELRLAAQLCDTDSSIKAVLLTANGRFFCAGGDLKEMVSYGNQAASHVKNLADNLHMAISNFSRMSPPLIIAINGMAAGAGFSLAVSGDYVIASESAAFTMAYTKAGLSPDGSSSYFLPRLIGLRRTQDLMLTNRILTSHKALEWGLVSQVVESDDLHSSAMELAQKLASGSLASHSIVKKLLLCSFNNSLETQMEIEGRYISQCVGSADGQEGIMAFSEKRAPKFK